MNSSADNVDAALAWIARLSADTVGESDRQAFALWLAESDANRDAMDAAEALWGDVGAALEVLPVRPAPPRYQRWIPTAVAAAATLFLAVFFWTPGGHQPAEQVYRSAKGERVEVSLPDGSRALLNTETVIAVSYSDDARAIDLRGGQAWFSVAKNPEKPFHVTAGTARVTALGTAFDVYRRDAATEVTVTEGVVSVAELEQPGNRAPRTEILHQHQVLLAGPQAWSVSRQPQQAIEEQLAWRDGRLVATGMPLPELVSQLERYQATTYLLGSPGLASLTVSGVFDLDQPQSILRALEVSLDLEARQVNERTVQLERKAPQD